MNEGQKIISLYCTLPSVGWTTELCCTCLSSDLVVSPVITEERQRYYFTSSGCIDVGGVNFCQFFCLAMFSDNRQIGVTVHSAEFSFSLL